MKGTIKQLKVAWIRESGYPIGSPAPGYFNCKCGMKITGIHFGQSENIRCPKCLTVYDGKGWIISHGD